MTYERIDRLKKYMQKKIDAIVTGEKVTFNINAHQLLNEINEMERKAKAFDAILKIDNQATDEDRITGEYESDIETVLSEYMEGADDER